MGTDYHAGPFNPTTGGPRGKIKTQVLFGITVDWSNEKLWKKLNVLGPVWMNRNFIIWSNGNYLKWVRDERKRDKERNKRLAGVLYKMLERDFPETMKKIERENENQQYNVF